MYTPAVRIVMLMEMRDEAILRLERAQAELDSIDWLIDVERALEPPIPHASPQEVREGAIAVLTESGEPVHRNVILEKLEERGIRVGGKSAVATLGANLCRFSKDFEPHGRGFWGLKKFPTPSSNGTASHPSQREVSSAR